MLTKLLIESVFLVPMFSTVANGGYTHRGEAGCRVTQDGHADGVLPLRQGLFRPLQLPGVALNWSSQKLERRLIVADDGHFKSRLSRSFEH